MKIFIRYIFLSVMLGVLIMTPMEEIWNSGNNEGGPQNSDRSTTACMGRFIVVFPGAMEFSYGDTRVAGWQVSSNPSESEQEFSVAMATREAELLGQKNQRGLPSLESNRSILALDLFGKIFIFDRKWNYHLESRNRIDHEWFSAEAVIRLNGVSFRFFMEIADQKDIFVVEELIKNLRTRKRDEVPTQPGFCIEDGFIADTLHLEERGELSVIFAGYRNRPDLAIAFSSMSGATGSTTLLERATNSQVRELYPNAFKRIFEGPREINGIPGEESSERVKELNGTRAHTYMWESRAVGRKVMRPLLSLELTTGIGRPGEPVNSSMSDNEVQNLWNQISSSIRPRPVKIADPKTAPEESLPSHSDAGTPCPVSGWWSCVEHADGYEVLGGTSQYFAAGVRMPQAELYGPANFFGRRTTFVLSTPTRWKLVKERS